MRNVGESGKPVLFVGTKKQAQQAIEDEATRCGQYYVSERWLGGMLTNHKTIAKRIQRLNDIRRMEEDGTCLLYTSSVQQPKQQKQTKQPKQPLMQRIKEMKTGYKVAALVVIILLLAVIIVGAVVWNYMNRVVDEMHEPIQENYDLSLVGVDGYINILLLGVDSRNMDNIKGTRSDMIMIASINEETNDVTLTSVYRDTYLKLGDTATYDKITHACVYGGPEMTMKSLNQALDIDPVSYTHLRAERRFVCADRQGAPKPAARFRRSARQ